MQAASLHGGTGSGHSELTSLPGLGQTMHYLDSDAVSAAITHTGQRSSLS